MFFDDIALPKTLYLTRILPHVKHFCAERLESQWFFGLVEIDRPSTALPSARAPTFRRLLWGSDDPQPKESD